MFFGFDHARSIIAEWADEYNHSGPHSSLGYKTPADFREYRRNRLQRYLISFLLIRLSRGVNGLKIIHLSPSDISVAVSPEVRDEQTLSSVEDAVRVIERQIKRAYPAIRQLFLEVQAQDDHLSDLRRHTNERDSPGEG